MYLRDKKKKETAPKIIHIHDSLDYYSEELRAICRIKIWVSNAIFTNCHLNQQGYAFVQNYMVGNSSVPVIFQSDYF